MLVSIWYEYCARKWSVSSIFFTIEWLWHFCRPPVHTQCSIQRAVLPNTHSQVILDGDAFKCSQKIYFFSQLDYKSYSCYACPVLNTCFMCSSWAISTLRVHYDKSGGLQISRHRWAVLAKWIHPWQLMSDVLVVILGFISCTVAILLHCIQWIINWHACPLLKVKQFQRRIIPCDMQLLAVVVSVMCGNYQWSSDGDGPRRWRNIYSLQSRFSGESNASKF